jgi:hypothetical protein
MCVTHNRAMRLSISISWKLDFHMSEALGLRCEPSTTRNSLVVGCMRKRLEWLTNINPGHIAPRSASVDDLRYLINL